MRTWSGSDRRYPPLKLYLFNKNKPFTEIYARGAYMEAGLQAYNAQLLAVS
jgi:hypothetical protein